VDRDTFVERHAASWDRLAELVGRGHLSAAESDELVRLYLRASSHLATARRRYRDPELLLHLNGLVARANARVHGARHRTLHGVRLAVTRTFPAAVWELRRAIGLATAVFLVVFGATTAWIATSPAALDVAIPPEVRDAYLAEDFANYYSSQPAGQFATLVFTNNARVGILAFASGIAFAVPTLAVLAYNALNVGVAAGAFHAAGRASLFWGLILPHGLLELTAIFVAAGTGLRLGWALVAPGDRTRGAALAEEARRAIVVVLGLVVVFLVAGLLEAFVTPSPLPTWARVGTGVVVEIAFLAYVVGFGREAAAHGWTGALGEARHRASRVTAVPSP
jgi:uncharacterized membrane protein SpoIIM required for sporulation